MKSTWMHACGIAAGALLSLAAERVDAQDLSSYISCLRGTVDAFDYHELDQQLKESGWDSKGGVALTSTLGGLELRVVDSNGNSVCDETADNTTSCYFKVNLTSVSQFTIFVDNKRVATANSYKICAF